MRAMFLEHVGQPLVERDVPTPFAGPGQLLVRVSACGVCRTDLHVVDGELPNPTLPLIPGHEVVGRVAAVGAGVEDWSAGERVGIPWLASTCGNCEYCRRDQENLCSAARFTGYTWNGGYAEFAAADARYCLRIPDRYSDQEAAPLLCAGLIGYRCLRKAGNARRLGLYGFGAAAHLIAQIARAQGQTILAFNRTGDSAAGQFARSFGAEWAGASTDLPPQPLDAAILFAPAGELVPAALRAVKPGGLSSAVAFT